jgi:glycosyltransferase involved in cell wall biosynthesis
VAHRTLSIIVPAYNEALNLRGAVLDVVQAAEAVGLEAWQVIIVDDGSTDETYPVARQLAQESPGVEVIHHPRNRGFAAAYRSGLAAARMDYVTFIPGDNEVAVESVQAIFAAIGSADLVVPYHGTPWLRPWGRRLLTWVSVTEVNILFGWNQRYFQGPTVYPSDLARALPVGCSGFFFVTEMLVQALEAEYTWVEIGLQHQQRAYGRSKAVSLAKILDAEHQILRLWWDMRVRRRRTSLSSARATSADAVSAIPQEALKA